MSQHFIFAFILMLVGTIQAFSLNTAHNEFRERTLSTSREERRLAGKSGFTSIQLSGSNDNNLDKGFNLLGSSLIPQGLVVGTAKEGWKFAWKRMMAELAPQDKTGNYQRPTYGFTNMIGTSLFPDADNRYHLYIGNPCPWCHRALLAVKILGLTDSQITLTRLEDNPVKASRGGWVFAADQPDPIYKCRDLRELYDRLSGGSYEGRCTAPLLVDKKQRKIVSNESSDIVRTLNRAMLGSKHSDKRIDLFPSDLESIIEETNEWVYMYLNNGVYRCGFATSQNAYNNASKDVLTGLERCDNLLSKNRYLCGNAFTEADLRLLPTILRFDGAYAPLFKAGGVHVRVRNYPHLHKWLQRCWYEVVGVSESIDIPDACASYYRSLFPLNPGGIIPTEVSVSDIVD
mmetsp:Transcript_18499/g.27953  ORF Transcript_18499/g.27953 Transcript_18499/m.27953 type:complete len:402 (-) Transcript_18499:107-1312(-)|eukprot:CAMPEP_0178900468 /NCGR_PEP_ID=MMETSP0786-20121207/3491_1 /TAXON_ID=186022 /ORGANISM="Thalassionema frauenfeldii, Strain CCMP 1798" /LENGTH=401 /DNA_ID=CAMNT_0020571477 /DNA_START=126 /DNA_END=1331 /DNA_ORIENTATION=-